MSHHLIIVGEADLISTSDYAADFEALLEELQPDDWEVCTIAGHRLKMHIDQDVAGLAHIRIHTMLDDFINKHGEDGAVFRISEAPDDLMVIGRTYDERRLAHKRYCLEQIHYWVTLGENYKED